MSDESDGAPLSEQVSELLAAWAHQDLSARDRLIPLLYDELRRLAHHYMRGEREGHTLQTTALVNEMYLRLAGLDRMQWRDRAHFMAMVATLMRRVLVDHARAVARDKRGGGRVITSIEGLELPAPGDSVDIIELDEALEDLSAVDPQQSQVVQFRFFGGLTVEETAEALDISPATVKRDWVKAKAWLQERLAVAENPAFLESLTTMAESPSDPLVGRTVSSYRVEARIGAGGMGEVYKAHDTKLDRPVALKVLVSRFAQDPERLRRFRAEARAASSLNHPNILVIHDFGELDDRPYMVSEFVEGETLRQRLQRGSLSLTEAVELTLQVAAAVAAAHSRGIVHRDIKPENVMVRPDGYVKVLDFGIAKLIAVEPSGRQDDALHTTPGMVIGTPRYMSPEQARGIELDARSDVWSIGVLLYELATGRPPFGGATPADLIGAILSAEPVPMELQAPETPPALARVVVKALQKDRLERYPSAAGMAADLSAVKRQLDRDEPAWRPASPPGLAADQPSPTPARTTKRTRIIVIPFRLLRSDPETDFLGFSLADAMATTLSGLDSVIVRSSMTAARFAREDVDVKEIAREADVDAVLMGTLLRAGNQIRVTAQVIAAPQGTIMWSDRIDVAVDDVFRLQDELSRRLVDALAVPLTVRDQEILQRDVPASAKGYELYLRANVHFYHPENWTIARDLLIGCVTEDPQYAPAWARLGRCYRLTAKYKSATVAEVQENMRRAEVAFRKAFDLNPDLPAGHHLYTALETDLGRAEDAMARLLRRVRQRRGDPELYAGLVHACRYCGLLDESLAAHERARELDPHVSTSVAQTYWLRGEYERATQVGIYGFFVGFPLVSLGRLDEALAAAKASAAVVHDPMTRSYQSILPLMLEGRTADCLRLLDELAPKNPDPESVFHVARTYARLGAHDRAIASFDRAVSMGFFCYPYFERDDWLDPLRAAPAFDEIMTRARRRHEAAAALFRDAHGGRLLGITASASSTDRPSG